jgi:hypothetical protein
MTGIPDVLYHYTTANGLLGILRTSTLWASNLTCMNDFSELRYATNLIDKELRAALELSDCELSKHLLSNEDVSPFSAISHKYSVYACCFCKEGNSLSQWRAYAEKAAGYSLGIETKRILEFLNRGKLKQNLIEVIYSPEHQRALIKPEIMECIENATRTTLPGDEKEKYKVVVAFWSDCYKRMFRFLYSFKDPAFSEEHEWRIVVPDLKEEDMEEVQFREIRGQLVPYIELRFPSPQSEAVDQIPIIEIIQGPLVDQTLGEKPLELLKKKYAYNDVKIRKSLIPLRF